MLTSWQEFLRGKRKKKDVAEFSVCLMDNILALHAELAEKTYRHGQYQAFKINDPKPRDIHKANVRDRLVHHAIYRILYPYFDRKFIYDSHSCRNDKGTHRAINRFRYFARKVSRNSTRTAWILKCDVKKFFANINHKILFSLLRDKIEDENAIWLFKQVIGSFCTCHPEFISGSRFEIPKLFGFAQDEQVRNDIGENHVGLPLGNLTSQLLINIYMNGFDHFIKRELRAKYYLRYADDFVIMSENKTYLEQLIPKISNFFKMRLKLSLHPKKVSIKTLSSGIDFLGWVNFPYHRVLRTSTKRRMFKKLKNNYSDESVVSYLGLLKHGNTYKLIKELKVTIKEKMGL